jgi:hypothetical protein
MAKITESDDSGFEKLSKELSLVSNLPDEVLFRLQSLGFKKLEN